MLRQTPPCGAATELERSGLVQLVACALALRVYCDRDLDRERVLQGR